jgi:hypothetical protein
MSPSAPPKTEGTAPRTTVVRTPRFGLHLMTAAGLCTTLAYVAAIGPKLPAYMGE